VAGQERSRDSNGVEKKKAYSLLVCCSPMLVLAGKLCSARVDRQGMIDFLGGAQGMGRFPWAFGLPDVHTVGT
jgi:hypothetical protein